MFPWRKLTQNLKPLWIPVTILGGLLLVSLVVQLTLAWLSYQRILPVDQHVRYLEQLQRNLTRVETTLASHLGGSESSPLSPDAWQNLHDSLQRLLNQANYLADSTPGNVQRAQQVLDKQSVHPEDSLLVIQQILRTVFVDETAVHQTLTHNILHDAEFQLELVGVVLLLLPASAIILLILMRRRIYSPLQHMGYLMEALGRKEYQTIQPSLVDPMFQPLTENYNRMVQRLAVLEAEHQQRKLWLEDQVETATRALMEQQFTLANTERLAALGEVMARIAHELRNPLAGIQMACTNMQKEMAENRDAEPYEDRMGMVVDETRRIIQLLNNLLAQARHEPEPLRKVDMQAAVRDLLKLAHYQMPEHITLVQQVPPGIVCALPDIQLRQALLNLILNARQALDEQAGTITVSAEREEEALMITVCDDGPGFPSDMLQDGIRSFRTHRQSGTGLGLSMVQRFVRSHDGKLELRNREPHGACVTLRLKCGASA